MPNEYYSVRNTGPDERTVTIIDFRPDKPEPEVEPLRLGLAARDTCGDGTDEFKHIEPLVTWQVFPVPVFLESSIPGGLRSAVITSFEAFNKEAGFKLYEFTDNLNVAKVRVSIGPIDVAGNTIARAQWSYRISTKEITRATITFDSNENWGALSNESCGKTGNIFDCANVGTHEFGHISGLSHAPTDQLQTMFASTSPGKTLGRTLGNGDKKGFKLAYKVITPPPPPPPPENRPPIANSFGVQTEQDKEIMITLQGSDPDGDQILYQIIDKPVNGNLSTVEFTGRVWSYLPNQGFSGIDTFTYVVNDSKGAASNKATVTINVKAVTPEPPEPEPEPIPPIEHNFTQAEKAHIKILTLMYENAKKSGIESFIKQTREDLQNYIIERLIEKHSPQTPTPEPEPEPEPEPKPGDCGPDPDPNNEHVKPGGWGGDTAGATTWEAVVMGDDPNLWKVVDKAGTNIAHKFASEAEAIAYIKYQQCVQEGGDPDPDPKPCPSGQHRDSTGKCVPDEEPSPTGDYPYPVIGQPMQSTQRGPTTRHYASGKPDDETIEKNVKNIKFKNYQWVCYVTMHEVEHSDTLSVKYGGTHMGSGWFDHGISFGDGKGQCCMGKEEDHPSTDLCVIKGPQLGEILEKKVGIAGIYYKDQNFCELWIDMGDGWKKQMEAKDVGGFNPGSDVNEAQLRIDGFKKGSVPTIHSAIVTEI